MDANRFSQIEDLLRDCQPLPTLSRNLRGQILSSARAVRRRNQLIGRGLRVGLFVLAAFVCLEWAGPAVGLRSGSPQEMAHSQRQANAPERISSHGSAGTSAAVLLAADSEFFAASDGVLSGYGVEWAAVEQRLSLREWQAQVLRNAL